MIAAFLLGCLVGALAVLFATGLLMVLGEYRSGRALPRRVRPGTAFRNDVLVGDGIERAKRRGEL